MFSQVFCAILVHRKCISKIYYRSRGSFSIFPAATDVARFSSFIPDILYSHKWFSVWFRSILSIQIHIYGAAAYLPSAFLLMLLNNRTSTMTLYLFIYFHLVFSFAISCLANSFLHLLQFILFSISSFTVRIKLSFHYLLVKNIRRNMRSHYPIASKSYLVPIFVQYSSNCRRWLCFFIFLLWLQKVFG